MKKVFLSLSILFITTYTQAQQKRARDYGLTIGVMAAGEQNAITDVQGLKVGQVTLIKGDSVRTGVTAIIPYEGNIFQQKVPAAIYVGNGFGKLAGVTQVAELGTLETPILLTNTLNVATGIDALIDYTLQQPGNETVQSVNAVVGETNDGHLNDIRGRHVTKADMLAAINNASATHVQEGNVGAGTGTVCFGFKGGIGTASRVLPEKLGSFTVGVLVQTNFGGVLQINGAPVGKELQQFSFSNELLNNVDGSCMMVVATDAPLDSRNLARLAKRAFLGLGKTGGIASNGSGDYVIAFSTATGVRVAHNSKALLQPATVVGNEQMSPLFMAAIEATEEAIINSLFAAADMTGHQGHQIKALPLKKVLPILKKYIAIK